MRFQFRLEKILNLVRLRETVKRMEVAAVLQKIRFLEGKKQSLQDEIRSSLERSATTMGHEWFSFQAMKIELDVKQQKKIDHLLIEEKEELTLRQGELSAIMQRRKGLETLKEKRLKEFKQVQNRRLQKQLDEIYQLSKGRM